MAVSQLSLLICVVLATFIVAPEPARDSPTKLGAPKSPAKALTENLPHHLPMHVGQTIVPALELERQPRVLDAEECRIVACRS